MPTAEQPGNSGNNGRRTSLNRIPDKYLAIGLFVLLLAVYLATNNSAVEKLMFSAFALVCTAIGDGLRRVSDWSARRLKGNEGTKEQKS